MIITIHADITELSGKVACTKQIRENCDAFAGFVGALFEQVAKTGKPILLVHGISDPYCITQDFSGRRAANLWRLNAGGDSYKPLDATVVTLNSGNPVAPFSVSGLIDKKILDVVCKD